MADSKLIPVPEIRDLLAHSAGRESDLAWWDAFNVACSRKYSSEWFDWYTQNRQRAQGTPSDSLLNATFGKYAQIMGDNMPWFGEAMSIVVRSDPKVEIPILALYFGAKLETLASLDTFQRKFLERSAFTIEAEAEEWLHAKIASAARHSPPTPFLFSAVANAYEHTFSFLMKMFGQYCHTFGEMPGLKEFDHLTRQLFVKLVQESQFSRKENAILEDHFQATDFFFTFTKNDSGTVLGINSPTAEERTEIMRRIEGHDVRHELDMQMFKSLLPHHYGCPAASGPVQFVISDVINAIRTAIWQPDYFDSKPIVPIEKKLRVMMLGDDPA